MYSIFVLLFRNKSRIFHNPMQSKEIFKQPHKYESNWMKRKPKGEKKWPVAKKSRKGLLTKFKMVDVLDEVVQ